MKRTTLMIITAMAVAFGLSACTDAEMAQVESNMAQAQANQAMKTGGIYSPSRGVLCDSKAGFCADSYGISMGLTKEYLGQAAQDKLMSYKDFDTSAFTMSNGVYCDARKQACFKDRYDGSPRNQNFTNKLFR